MYFAVGMCGRCVFTIKLKSWLTNAFMGLIAYLTGASAFLTSGTFFSGDFSFLAYSFFSAFASLFLRGEAYLIGVTLFFAGDFLGSAFLAVPVFLAGVTASF